MTSADDPGHAHNLMTPSGVENTPDSHEQRSTQANSTPPWLNGALTGLVLTSAVVAVIDDDRPSPNPLYDVVWILITLASTGLVRSYAAFVASRGPSYIRTLVFPEVQSRGIECRPHLRKIGQIAIESLLRLAEDLHQLSRRDVEVVDVLVEVLGLPGSAHHVMRTPAVMACALSCPEMSPS